MNVPINRGRYAPSQIKKHSIILRQHKTSASLEEAFWISLRDIANFRGITLTLLLQKIDDERTHSNLSSAMRLFVLDHYRKAALVAQVPKHPTLQPSAEAVQ